MATSDGEFDDVSESDRPAQPQIPSPEAGIKAVKNFLVEYWMWNGFSYRYSVVLANKLRVSGEVLYAQSEADLVAKYDRSGSVLYDRIQRSKHGLLYCFNKISQLRLDR